MDNDNLQYQLSVSRVESENKAYLEYDVYKKTQRIDSDFEKTIYAGERGMEHEW